MHSSSSSTAAQATNDDEGSPLPVSSVRRASPSASASGQPLSGAESVEPCWIIAPHYDGRETEMEPQGMVVVDFNDSLARRMFGQKAHHQYFRSLGRYRVLIKLTGLLYSVGICAAGVVPIIDEAHGGYLSIFALFAVMPGTLQLFLSTNTGLFQTVLKSSQFWSFVISSLILWATAGLLLGRTRSIFILGFGLLGTTTGGLADAVHYRFRSSQSSFWTFLTWVLLFCSMTISIVMKVFRGGTTLRWRIGSRELTGEDILVNAAATVLVCLIPHIKLSWRWPRIMGKGKSLKAHSGQKRIQCPIIQWPLKLQLTTVASRPSKPCNESVASPAGLPPSDGKASDLGDCVVPLVIEVPTNTYLHAGQTLFNHLHHLQFFRGTKSSQGDNSTLPTSSSGGHKYYSWCRRSSFLHCSATLGAGLMTLVAFYLGKLSKASDVYELSWLSPAVAVLGFLWSTAVFVYFLTSWWNASLVRCILRTSFNFWFLVGQTLSLLWSLSDAFSYDERSLALLGWCLLYVSCLLSDAILPAPSSAGDTTPGLTKRFLGLGLLLPLLVTQGWFLYDIVFADGLRHLRIRRVLQVSKHFEEGSLTPEQHIAAILNFSTDSFIIARQTTLIFFSLPYLYHLAVRCGGWNWRRMAAIHPSSSEHNDQLSHVKVLASSRDEHYLYFITGSVSYCAPRRQTTTKKPRVQSVDHRST